MKRHILYNFRVLIIHYFCNRVREYSAIFTQLDFNPPPKTSAQIGQVFYYLTEICPDLDILHSTPHAIMSVIAILTTPFRA